MIDLFGQWLGNNAGNLRLLSLIGITVHWYILQYSIGLLTFAVTLEIYTRWRNDEKVLKMSKVISKVAVVIFSVGAATGTMSEFGLIIFWPNLLVLVGRYFFVPMYIEVFAFLAEVVFVYLYYYTWEREDGSFRINPKVHVLIGLAAVCGAILSALLILSVNTLMHIPPGLVPGYDEISGIWVQPSFDLIMSDGTEARLLSSEVQNTMLTDTDTFHGILLATVAHIGIFGIVLTRPGVLITFFHTVFAALTVTSFTILGVYFWRYLTISDKENENEEQYYSTGIKLMSVISLIMITIQGAIFGPLSGELVAKYNPEKLAAMEGTSNTIFSLTQIPILRFDQWLIPFLAYRNFDAIIPVWDDLPALWQPPLIIHYIYYAKIGISIALGLFMVGLFVWFFLLKKNVNEIPRIILRLGVFFPFLINFVASAGWMTKEIGRKPWTVYGMVTAEQAATTVEIPWYIVLGVIVYSITLLGGLMVLVWYLFRKTNTSEINLDIKNKTTGDDKLDTPVENNIDPDVEEVP
jgi:cytochrome d ubiquinol oxidase subunit I